MTTIKILLDIFGFLSFALILYACVRLIALLWGYSGLAGVVKVIWQKVKKWDRVKIEIREL